MYIFNCPHCDMTIEVEESQLNCKIFRCGIYKNNYTQIPQHSTKIECDILYNTGKIYGCGKPFIYDGKNVKICDYI